MQRGKRMDHSGDESLLKQPNKLSSNAVGFVFNILQLLFWSIWQGFGKHSSRRNQAVSLSVSEINLEVLKYSFQPPLICSFCLEFAPPPKLAKEKWKWIATKSCAAADTKNTTQTGFQKPNPHEMLRQICCCSYFTLLKITQSAA